MKIHPEMKQQMLENLHQRLAEIEAAIVRIEADDETVLLESAAFPDY